MEWIRSGAAVGQGSADPCAADEAEADLVARAKVEPRAFGALYDRYADAVYRYCYRRLGTREAAEDATSQVFLKALTALPRYRERGSFAGWLFAIAHNAVADAQRRQARFVPGTTDDRVDRAPTPEEHLLAAEQRLALRDLLGQLPPDQRRAVELRLAGLTGVEIARVLGRSHRAVKMLQHRAMTKLRALLDIGPRREGDDDDRR